MLIYEIPQRLKVTWHAEARAVIDTWTNYTITDEEFRTAVLIKGVNHAKSHNARAWIVDSSNAKGLFRQSQLDLINREIHPTFKRIGIQYFITVKPRDSVFTEISVNQYSELVAPHGLELVEAGSVEEAIAWLNAR